MVIRFVALLLVCYSTLSSAQNAIVHFPFNSFELTVEARDNLQKLVRSGKVNSLAIFGHTDLSGSFAYNEWLSLVRARAVQDYLFSKGVKPAQISVLRGFGATRPISNLADSFSMQLNRRVVLMNGYKPSRIDEEVAARQANITQRPERLAPTVATSIIAQEAVPAVVSPAAVAPKEPPIVKQQKSEKLIEDIRDKNTKAGENIVLKNINFLPGSHAFLSTAYPALADLLETMQKIKTLEVEIQGHVCCQDGATDALDNATGEMTLSVTRAKAVYDYLVQNGIEPSRLSYKGLAHQFPLIAVEITEDDRIANRRVEIKLIKK